MTDVLIRAALVIGGAMGAWFLALAILGLVRALAIRGKAIMDAAAQVAAEAISVAAAWPFEMALIQADRIVAAGSEWRDQRRIWRAEFRHAMSWEAFRRQMAGQEAESAERDAMAEALDLLGLREPFTRADLDQRFKRIMQGVHPDTGGSDLLARMVNDARALIIERKGWKR